MRSSLTVFPGLMVGLFSCSLRQTPDVVQGPVRSPEASTKPSPDLVVAIAVREDQTDERTIRAKLPFSIVFVNQGDKPLRLWKESCVWGYFGLKFEMTTKDGKKVVLEKRRRDLFAKFRDSWNLAPKEVLVRDVTLGGNDWMGLEVLGKGEHTVRLRAIYAVREDDGAKAEGVWTGKVTSQELEYLLDIPVQADDFAPKR